MSLQKYRLESLADKQSKQEVKPTVEPTVKPTVKVKKAEETPKKARKPFKVEKVKKLKTKR